MPTSPHSTTHSPLYYTLSDQGRQLARTSFVLIRTPWRISHHLMTLLHHAIASRCVNGCLRAQQVTVVKPSVCAWWCMVESTTPYITHTQGLPHHVAFATCWSHYVATSHDGSTLIHTAHSTRPLCTSTPPLASEQHAPPSLPTFDSANAGSPP